MITIKRTEATNKDFIELTKQLDLYLKKCDGEDHAFYAQFNKIETLKYVLIAYENNIAIGCGAIKPWQANLMEIKRMYVHGSARRKGLASTLLTTLENWAKELGYKKCILETGVNQLEAIQLYKNRAYIAIENYGQYAGVATSLCFEKVL